MRGLHALAATLAVEPQEGDWVTIRGRSFLIAIDGGAQSAVTSDPALATWTCRGRG